MKNFLGKRILVITAHPDDEAFTAAAAILENQKRGGETFLVCATLGEKGRAYSKKKVSTAEMKEIRRKELVASSRRLGISDTRILNVADGKVTARREVLKRRAGEAIRLLRPDLILSFGVDGFTGHIDHIATYHVARELAQEFGLPLFVFYPPQGKAFREWMGLKKKGNWYAGEENSYRHTMRIEGDPEEKLSILRVHTSQFPGLNPFLHFPPAVSRKLLTREYFRLDFVPYVPEGQKSLKNKPLQDID